MGTTDKDTLFEWDERKNLINVQKHGISFDSAIVVFKDELRVEYYDEIHSVDEDRFIVIGYAYDILFVVYTMRNNKARIISARLANDTERNVYYGRFKRRENSAKKDFFRSKADRRPDKRN